jgi:uncharacterized protein YehS (DUF1456 family)
VRQQLADAKAMTNNDILRRLRYTFDLSDSAMLHLFELGGLGVSRAVVSDWLKRDEDPAHQPCADEALSAFLNGLIIDRRGPTEGPAPEPELRLNNNLVLRKLKIALSLRDTDMLELLALAGFPLGKSELSAFFRHPAHKHFRLCQDQVLRNFLRGLQAKHRASPTDESEPQEA